MQTTSLAELFQTKPSVTKIGKAVGPVSDGPSFDKAFNETLLDNRSGMPKTPEVPMQGQSETSDEQSDLRFLATIADGNTPISSEPETKLIHSFEQTISGMTPAVEATDIHPTLPVELAETVVISDDAKVLSEEALQKITLETSLLEKAQLSTGEALVTEENRRLGAVTTHNTEMKSAPIERAHLTPGTSPATTLSNDATILPASHPQNTRNSPEIIPKNGIPADPITGNPTLGDAPESLSKAASPEIISKIQTIPNLIREPDSTRTNQTTTPPQIVTLPSQEPLVAQHPLKTTGPSLNAALSETPQIPPQNNPVETRLTTQVNFVGNPVSAAITRPVQEGALNPDIPSIPQSPPAKPDAIMTSPTPLVAGQAGSPDVKAQTPLANTGAIAPQHPKTPVTPPLDPSPIVAETTSLSEPKSPPILDRNNRLETQSNTPLLRAEKPPPVSPKASVHPTTTIVATQNPALISSPAPLPKGSPAVGISDQAPSPGLSHSAPPTPTQVTVSPVAQTVSATAIPQVAVAAAQIQPLRFYSAPLNSSKEQIAPTGTQTPAIAASGPTVITPPIPTSVTQVGHPAATLQALITNPAIQPLILHEALSRDAGESSFVGPSSHTVEVPQTNTARLAADAQLTRHVAQQLTEMARLAPDRPMEIALNPEELGRVRMTLHPSEAGMQVTLVAERPETADLLRRNIEMLAAEFRELGYSSTSFTFSGDESNQNGNGQSDTGGGINVSPDASPEQNPSDPISRNVTLNGGVDLRL